MSHEARDGCVTGPPLAPDVGAAMTELRRDMRPEEDPFPPWRTALLRPCPSGALTPADPREELVLEREEGKRRSGGAGKELQGGAETSQVARPTGLRTCSLSFAAHGACPSRRPSPWAFLSPLLLEIPVPGAGVFKPLALNRRPARLRGADAGPAGSSRLGRPRCGENRIPKTLQLLPRPPLRPPNTHPHSFQTPLAIDRSALPVPGSCACSQTREASTFHAISSSPQDGARTPRLWQPWPGRESGGARWLCSAAASSGSGGLWRSEKLTPASGAKTLTLPLSVHRQEALEV